MFKGVFFSADPGGTNALIPIAKKILEEKDFKILIFASSFAIPLWEQAGIEFTSLPNSINNEEADRLLKNAAPDFLFTGTSENPHLEGALWRAAKQQKIVTYSVIDHWTRYKERYIVNGVFLPTDLIFVIDDESKKEMISLGFKEGNIVVSGQPHFEKFYGYESELSRKQFCDTNQLSERKIILFVSDNIAGSFPTDSIKPVLGFDEQSILKALLNELETIPSLTREFQLIIKLHPKEPLDNFSDLLSQQKLALPNRILQGGNNMDLLFHADFVIGMFSMLLFEAFLMNKPVLSLQLNTIKPISFGKISVPIITESIALSGTLQEFLAKKTHQKPHPFMPAVKTIFETVKSNLYLLNQR